MSATNQIAAVGIHLNDKKKKPRFSAAAQSDDFGWFELDKVETGIITELHLPHLYGQSLY